MVKCKYELERNIVVHLNLTIYLTFFIVVCVLFYIRFARTVITE